jgi:hypothetical protein
LPFHLYTHSQKMGVTFAEAEIEKKIIASAKKIPRLF